MSCQDSNNFDFNYFVFSTNFVHVYFHHFHNSLSLAIYAKFEYLHFGLDTFKEKKKKSM